MTVEKLILQIQNIVKQSYEMSKVHVKEDMVVNYSCIFCQTEKEFIELKNISESLGYVIKNTPTGPLFHIKKLTTVAGDLKLLKIRKPDTTRTELGDADFTIENHHRFKEKYLKQEGFTSIQREDLEMIELIDPKFNVRAYFSNPTIDKILNI